jgi:hypothetical protein
MLDDVATVPFIARYRKEVTGAVEDAQLRVLDERLRYLRELEERRAMILNSIREPGKRRRASSTPKSRSPMGLRAPRRLFDPGRTLSNANDWRSGGA